MLQPSRDASIVLVSKTTEWCSAAERLVAACAPHALVIRGERGDPFPPQLADWSGDYLISFLSPWVMPPSLLARTSRAAINFHPGSPDYPGFACYSFALYDMAQTYGVTCHHMDERVDSGR